MLLRMMAGRKEKQNKKMGEILLEQDAITRDQLCRALEHQAICRLRLGQILSESLQCISQDSIDQKMISFLTTQHGFPYLNLESYEVDLEAVKMVPKELAGRFCMIALDRIGCGLTVAMANPLNLEAISKVEQITNCKLQPFVSIASEIDSSLESCYARISTKRMSKEPVENRLEEIIAERRKEKRFKGRLPVSLRNHRHILSSETLDVSMSGILCALERSLELRTKVELSFNGSQSSSSPVKLKAFVVRVEPAELLSYTRAYSYKTALEFDQISGSDRLYLSHIIEICVNQNDASSDFLLTGNTLQSKQSTTNKKAASTQ